MWRSKSLAKCGSSGPGTTYSATITGTRGSAASATLSRISTDSPSVHRHRDAIRQIRKGRKLAPGLAISHPLEGQAAASLGRREEALQALERGSELAAPTSIFARVLEAWPAAVHAIAGDTARARRLMSAFEETPSGSFDRAVVHAALGEEEAALAALKNARLTDHYFRTFTFRYAPIFHPLRDEVGHRDLLLGVNRRVGLEPEGSDP